ncbi:hypothetical protein JCGZ_12367 [Jatropha curcas]|uniref:Uncharacterized protein n=1 Tax=Jatropha curcas TaxID=180498 RepID=A0A067K6N9_JATCU|nr:hypothetical protein JCGZ_12367 [Jatropha curcas]
MAETLVSYKWTLFLLALISWLQILFSQARPIKSTDIHQSSNDNFLPKAPAGFTSPKGANPVTSSSADDFRPTTGGHSPGAGHPKKMVTSSDVEHSVTKPEADGRTVKLHQNKLTGTTTASTANDFRPTKPGYSPGVGHPKQIVTSSNIEHSITGFKATKPVLGSDTYNLHQNKLTGTTMASTTNDFRPTSPGYSPGVGHPKKIDASSNVEHSVTGFKANIAVGGTDNLHQNKLTGTTIASTTNDFRPTSPGYSPGVGHPKKVDASSNVEHSVTGFKANIAVGGTDNLHQNKLTGTATASTTNDFRPTAPGYSPGVGHPKAVLVPSSTNSNVDDYRPTQPGHSPGVGHKKSSDLVPNPETGA